MEFFLGCLTFGSKNVISSFFFLPLFSTFNVHTDKDFFYSEDVFRIGCRNVSPNSSSCQDSMIIFHHGMSLLGSIHFPI